MIRASHILVKDEKTARKLKYDLDAGANFAMLAKKHSICPSSGEGGDLGFFRKGQMVKEFEDVAFSLPVGKVSEPLKTQFGWHLIVVTAKEQ
jgi:parvulin-like peptidyl-prolyl isomerase